MTPQQHEKLFEIFQRAPFACPHCNHNMAPRLRTRNYYTNETFDDFLSRSFLAPVDTCIMIEWQGMWLGVETDGHAHS